MAIYLDNAATTAPSQGVIQAISEGLQTYGNASSLHAVGLEAELAMDQTRKRLSLELNCESKEIFFTSGATESNNTVLRGIVKHARHNRHIVTSAVEHASVSATLTYFEQEQGFSVTRILPRDDGEFYAEDFLNAVRDETCLISMMAVENETGRVLPVEEVFRRAKRRYPHVRTHCDYVQGFLKIPTDLRYADFASVSAHKIHGAKGCGALLKRRGVPLSPLLTGGKQEQGFRPGTEGVPLYFGFGKAIEEMQANRETRYQHVCKLRDTLIEGLQQLPGIQINSSRYGTPYIINASILGIRSEILLHFLESKGIYVSSGSACSKGEKSHVLSAYGLKDSVIDSAIRISFCGENRSEEIVALLEAIQEGQKILFRSK